MCVCVSSCPPTSSVTTFASTGTVSFTTSPSAYCIVTLSPALRSSSSGKFTLTPSFVSSSSVSSAIIASNSGVTFFSAADSTSGNSPRPRSFASSPMTSADVDTAAPNSSVMSTSSHHNEARREGIVTTQERRPSEYLNPSSEKKKHAFFSALLTSPGKAMTLVKTLLTPLSHGERDALAAVRCIRHDYLTRPGARVGCGELVSFVVPLGDDLQYCTCTRAQKWWFRCKRISSVVRTTVSYKFSYENNVPHPRGDENRPYLYLYFLELICHL